MSRHDRPWIALALVAGCVTGRPQGPARAPVQFTQSAAEVDAFDFVEVVLRIDGPRARNPFTDVVVQGDIRGPDGEPRRVDGFCDALDGSVFRIRFMPERPGVHSYRVTYSHDGAVSAYVGTFRARDGRRQGVVRVDREHPWHFVWSGTGERYFWNSTTTYQLVGWDDETIRQSLDRLHRLRINRIRAGLHWRWKDGSGCHEPLVRPTSRFRMMVEPWVATRPEDLENPGFDVTRFNVAHWQKYERLLRHARERDIVVSVIFYVDGNKKGTDPFGRWSTGGPDEQRYYRYAAARLSAYSNVMWDVTNEYQKFRTEAWVDKIGTLLKEWDPYDHLASVHTNPRWPFRRSLWADYAIFQSWDEHGGHAFMLKQRQEQQAVGRPIPQVNEEYGYEDHYPTGWGEDRKPPSRSADTRRRLAWEMSMAGAYQTTGERADTGTGAGADTGGGWINGRGDASMVMLRGYAHIMDFFTAFAWWRTEPRDDLVEGRAFCLAEPGAQYALYLPAGGRVTVQLGPGRYRARWFDPRAGVFSEAGFAEGPHWTSPSAADAGDWALLLVRAP